MFGGVVELVVFLLGLGALSLAIYGTYRRFHPGRAVEGDDVADDATVEESGGRPG